MKAETEVMWSQTKEASSHKKLEEKKKREQSLP